MAEYHYANKDTMLVIIMLLCLNTIDKMFMEWNWLLQIQIGNQFQFQRSLIDLYYLCTEEVHSTAQ